VGYCIWRQWSLRAATRMSKRFMNDCSQGGTSKMSALGAAMRKLVHLCVGVLKTQQPYQSNYAKII
jgi:hypothetical protein